MCFHFNFVFFSRLDMFLLKNLIYQTFLDPVLTHLILFSTVAPNILPFDIDQALFSGESIQLSCHISKGDIPIDISWHFHGLEVSSNLGITTTKLGDRTSILMISSIKGSHSGNYTCVAKNNAGTATYSTTLQVHGRHSILMLSLNLCLI